MAGLRVIKSCNLQEESKRFTMKLIVCFVVTVMFFTSCEPENSSNGNLTNIVLIGVDDPKSFNKTVILYESNDLLVKTNFESFINTYPFSVLAGFEDLKEKAISDTLFSDTLEMTNYLRKNNDGVYIFAHHLEMGSCLIRSKKSGSIIKSIQMEKYSEGAPMQNISGRRFYINGKLFLETVDSIS